MLVAQPVLSFLPAPSAAAPCSGLSWLSSPKPRALLCCSPALIYCGIDGFNLLIKGSDTWQSGGMRFRGSAGAERERWKKQRKTLKTDFPLLISLVIPPLLPENHEHGG